MFYLIQNPFYEWLSDGEGVWFLFLGAVLLSGSEIRRGQMVTAILSHLVLKLYSVTKG